MYLVGRGVTRDYEQAILWFRRAAEQGNREGQHNLGFMYESGFGVRQADQEQAILWYLRAAAQDHAEARERLNRRRGDSPAAGG